MGGYTHFSKISAIDGQYARGAKGSEVSIFAAQELTASGVVTAGVNHLALNHSTLAIAATIATAVAHEGIMTIGDTSTGGTAGHTVTIATGTFDGTNYIATLNAPGETLVVSFDSDGAGTIMVNVGAVALSTT